MRRILLVLTAAALMATMLVVLQAPAMAQSFTFDDDDFFDHHHHNGFFDHRNFFDNSGFDQDIGDTGNVNISTRVSSSGNNSNQCVAPLQFGNTGSLQNSQEFSSFGSPFRNGFDNGFFNNGFDNGFFNNGFDNGFFNNGFGNVGDVEFGGSSFEFNPQQNVNCNQQVQQSAASSSGWNW